MKLRDTIWSLRRPLRELAAASGVRELRIFGSVARGDEREDSDVDFLVSLEPGRSLLDLARLEVRLEALLGRRVEVVTLDGLREPVRAAALRDAIDV